MIALFNIFNQPLDNQSNVIFSEFMDQVESGKISEVTIQGDRVSGKYTDGSSFQTMTPSKDQDLVRILREKGVRIVVVPPEQTSWYMNILISWFPMILLLGIWIFFMRQMQSGGGKALSFGKSKARLMNEDKNKITFKDVAEIYANKITPTYYMQVEGKGLVAIGKDIYNLGVPEMENQSVSFYVRPVRESVKRKGKPTRIKIIMRITPHANAKTWEGIKKSDLDITKQSDLKKVNEGVQGGMKYSIAQQKIDNTLRHKK